MTGWTWQCRRCGKFVGVMATAPECYRRCPCGEPMPADATPGPPFVNPALAASARPTGRPAAERCALSDRERAASARLLDSALPEWGDDAPVAR